MQAGKFKESLSVLELKQSGNTFRWGHAWRAWAEVEPQNKMNLFSKIGFGTNGVKFTLRKQRLTLRHMIDWNDGFFFPTDIAERDRGYLEVMAARVFPQDCTAVRQIQAFDELNRPTPTEETVAMFPGILTEKYLGFVQKEPYSETRTAYVLVTPKAIVLRAGDLVQTGGEIYRVQVPHTLDPFKNEYEIFLGRDA